MTEKEIVFWVIYAAAALCVVWHYVFVLIKVGLHEDKGQKGEKTEGISVIVVARNEVENLRTIIPAIIAQDYPRYELVVVDDRSCDGTALFLSSIQRNYPSLLKTVTIKEDTPYPWPGKKFSISMGVKAASYERIVLLEAGDRPSSQKWLSAISRGFSPSVRYVMGVCVTESSGTMAGWIHAVLKFSSRTMSFAWALAGKPYSGEVSDFSFTKTDFLSSMGYMNTMRIPAGEADFLLQSGGNAKNTAVVTAEDVILYTQGAVTWKDIWKKSVSEAAVWMKSSLFYKVNTLSFPFFRVLYMAAAVWGACMFYDLWWYWVVALCPFVLSMAVNYVCARRLHATPVVMAGMWTDVICLPVAMVMYTVAAMRIPARWK